MQNGFFAAGRQERYNDPIPHGKSCLVPSGNQNRAVQILGVIVVAVDGYGNGAAFNKTGTLFLAADEGAYLYKVNQEGALEAVSAKYDEFEGAFAIRTKILGRYVVSDLPLL